MLFSHFQSQINDAGTGELKVAVNTCQSEDPAKVVTENNPTAVKGALDDIDEKLMQHNGISKTCSAKCRTDLEQSVENIPAAVKGALDDIDEKFMQHNGISKICGAKCRTDLDQSVENIPPAVKGDLDDIDENFMQHNGTCKLLDIACSQDVVSHCIP